MVAIDFTTIDKQSETEPLKAIAFYQSVLAASENETDNKQKDIVIVKLSGLYSKTK